MRLTGATLLLILNWLSCTSISNPEMVSSSQDAFWKFIPNAIKMVDESPDVIVLTDQPQQRIDGFGTCFNELGWVSLRSLSEQDRNEIMKELFTPGKGANFSICRMPVGANDFARRWYSYDEIEGDFSMDHFSIANDQETLIPFIHLAQHYHPELRIWASPWSPPQWMKYNKHYAARSVLGDLNFQSEEWGMDLTGINNGLPKDQEGQEGTDMFIQEAPYYQAYALYFKKFIEAYREQGIPVFMVMPQNEFNSAQVFPSCTWTAKGLAIFIGQYLGPTMQQLGVQVFFGTMERPNEKLADTSLIDPIASTYISGVGFQWAGKDALPGIHERYPELNLYQTEQECGNGKNDWKNAVHSWDLMKHYFKNGVSVYLYWNTALVEGGISTWGWKQNSLISVDTLSHTFAYNPEYYVIKHASHYVQPGAQLLRTDGKYDNLLAFKNPDGQVVIIVQNSDPEIKIITVKIDDKNYQLSLPPDSFNTVIL